MGAFVALIQAHPTISALVAYYIASAFTASLPAPKKDSSPLYVFCFQFVNTLGANLMRAWSTRVENSPNFEAAVRLRAAADPSLQMSAKGGLGGPPPQP